MYFGSTQRKFEAYQSVAESIFDEIVSGRAKTSCEKGREFMSREYSYSKFKLGVGGLLKAVESPGSVKKINPRELRFNLSPWVRSWEQDTGRIISDYAHVELSDDLNQILGRVLGYRPAQISKRFLRSIEEPMSELFRIGVLSLSAEHGNAVRLAKLSSPLKLAGNHFRSSK